MGGVDEHFVGHEMISWRRAEALTRVERDTRGGRAAPNWGLNANWELNRRRVARPKAGAAAPPTTLMCSARRRGSPAPCALSMTLDLNFGRPRWHQPLGPWFL